MPAHPLAVGLIVNVTIWGIAVGFVNVIAGMGTVLPLVAVIPVMPPGFDEVHEYVVPVKLDVNAIA